MSRIRLSDSHPSNEGERNKLNSLTNRKTTVLWALLAMVGAMLFASAAAQAAPQAPVITGTPDNPNTTQAIATFEFEGAPGDPDPATNFQCRAYATASPPGAESGWYACESPFGFDGSPLPIQPNGDRTFQVRGRSGAVAGPASTFSWVQNVPAPTEAPVFSKTPSDPLTALLPPAAAFELEPAPLAAEFKCRMKEPGNSWNSCASNFMAGVINQLENGEHTVEARAENPAGAGPISEYTFTKNIPNPRASISLDGASSVRWGPTDDDDERNVSASLVSNAGDLNGDGRDDLVARAKSSTTTWVLFTPESGTNRPGDSMPPRLGYKIVTDKADTLFGSASYGAKGIGDQNGDGVPDLLLTQPDDLGLVEVYVVYGVSDARNLPKCNPNALDGVRCLDVTDLDSGQGYRLTDGGLEGFGFAGSFSTGINDPVVTGIGDVNGDNVEDILVGAPYAADGDSLSGAAWVIMGGREAPEGGQAINVFDLPAEEAIRIEGHNEGSGFGFGGLGGSVGDLDGDGLGDFALSANGTVPETAYIYLGKSLSGSPISTSDFGPSDGYKIVNNPTSVSKFFNVGDLNGDGQPDLLTGGPMGLVTANNTMTALFLPKSPSADAIPTSGLAPSAGYSLFGSFLGGEATLNGAANLGDVNGDGIPDQALGASASTVDGVSDAGSAFVTFGRTAGPDPNAPLTLNSATGPINAVRLSGPAKRFNRAGQQVVEAGDQDGDGLNDFWVTDVTTTRLVLSKNVVPSARTGEASDLTGNGAALNGAAGNISGQGEAHFEWGTTAEYGNETAAQTIDGASTVREELTGLEPNTTYHYRLVVTNGMGVVKYGEDQTFNSGPKYNHCKAVPSDCKGGGTKARLKMIPLKKRIAVKRGKRGVVSVAVINTGGKVARGVKVCVKAPKRLVRVKRCVRVGSLRSGASRTVKIRVQVKRKAKRGKKAVLRMTASGNGLAKRKAKARVVVR